MWAMKTQLFTGMTTSLEPFLLLFLLDFVPPKETAVTLNRVFFGLRRGGLLLTDHTFHQMPAMVS